MTPDTRHGGLIPAGCATLRSGLRFACGLGAPAWVKTAQEGPQDGAQPCRRCDAARQPARAVWTGLNDGAEHPGRRVPSFSSP